MKRAARRRTAARPGGPTTADLQAVFESAVDGIIIIDSRGTVEAFNPAAEKLFGMPASDIVGRGVNLLMPAVFHALHDRALATYMRTRRPHVVGIGREILGRRSDGTVFPMYLSVSEVRRGRQSRFVGMVHDLTNRKRLEQAIVRVSEDVRRQIGQEIHDVLGQQLTSITLLARASEKRARDGDRGEIRRLASEAMQQARRLSHGLYPAALERHGLSVALEELAETVRRTAGLDCRYVGARLDTDLDPTTALHLYRIAQEAVTNAARHSKARAVTVDLRLGRGGLLLSIDDDGMGLARHPKGAGGGVGLPIMKYRAGIIGGELTVRARSPHGVSVRCHIAGWPSGGRGDTK